MPSTRANVRSPVTRDSHDPDREPRIPLGRTCHTGMVLGSILPGLREIRTPLAVGYAWILVLYLAVLYRLPDPAHATGPLADAYRVGRLVTPVGIAVAASVAAYLVGVIVLPLTSALTKTVLRWRRIAPFWLLARLPGRSPEDQISEAFEAIAVDHLADRVRDDQEFRAALVRHGVEVSRITGAEIDEARLDELLRKDSAVRQEAIREASDYSWKLGELDDLLPLMVQRMRGHDDQAASEYERLTAESGFRAGMAWPLLTMLMVLAARGSTWWLIGLPAVLPLISSASAASLQAALLLSTVIASRRYGEPIMQVLASVPAPQFLNRKAQSAGWARQAARVVVALAVSPDNLVIAGGTDDGHLLLWDAGTGELRQSWAAHRDSVEALAFSPDSTRLITAGSDGVARVWDPRSGQSIHALYHQHTMAHLAVDPTTGLLVVATSNGLNYWNLAEGERVKQRTFDNTGIYSMSMSPDGTLVIGCLDNAIVVVRGDQTLDTVKTKTGELMRCVALNEGLLVSLEMDKNNQYRLARWHRSDNGLVSSVLATPWEPHPPVVAADHGSTAKIVFATARNEIALLSLDEELPPRILSDHTDTISALAVSSDRAILVSASQAGTVQVREVSTGKLLLRLVPVIRAS